MTSWRHSADAGHVIGSVHWSGTLRDLGTLERSMAKVQLKFNFFQSLTALVVFFARFCDGCIFFGILLCASRVSHFLLDESCVVLTFPVSAASCVLVVVTGCAYVLQLFSR